VFPVRRSRFRYRPTRLVGIDTSQARVVPWSRARRATDDQLIPETKSLRDRCVTGGIPIRRVNLPLRIEATMPYASEGGKIVLATERYSRMDSAPIRQTEPIEGFERPIRVRHAKCEGKAHEAGHAVE